MIDDTKLHFVDTNMLIYANDDSDREKHERASQLINGLWETNQGCLSMQVLQEFYVTVTRKIPQPYTPEKAAEVIKTLSSWRVHSPTANDIQKAIQLQTRYQISFWDAMILNSAVSLGCDVLWSEDLNAGQVYDGVLLSNPFEDESI